MKRAIILIALAFSSRYSFAQLSQQNQQMIQQAVQALQQQQITQQVEQQQHNNQNYPLPASGANAVPPVLSPQMQQMVTQTTRDLQQAQVQEQPQQRQAVPSYQFQLLLGNGYAIQGQSFTSMQDAEARAWNIYLRMTGGEPAQGDDVQQNFNGSGAVTYGTQGLYQVQMQANGIIYQGQSALSQQQAMVNAQNAFMQTMQTGALGTYVGPNGEGTGTSFYNSTPAAPGPTYLPPPQPLFLP